MFVDISHAWVLPWHEHGRHNTPLFVEEEVHLQESYDSVHQQKGSLVATAITDPKAV